MGELEHCSEHDQVHVEDISATEGGGLAKDVQNGGMSREERREDDHEAKEEQPAGQGQSPVCMRKPPNHYGEWIWDIRPTKDVGGQAKRGQGEDKKTETKIAEEG